jgi:hypothetical protein
MAELPEPQGPPQMLPPEPKAGMLLVDEDPDASSSGPTPFARSPGSMTGGLTGCLPS